MGSFDFRLYKLCLPPHITSFLFLNTQILSEEVKTEKPNWDKVMAVADEVLSMKSISDDDRRQIQQEKSAVKNQWDALKDNIDWRTKR